MEKNMKNLIDQRSQEIYQQHAQEMHQLYQDQLCIWFELLPEASQLRVIEQNKNNKEHQYIERLITDPNISWN
jgi:hypothetical protein